MMRTLQLLLITITGAFLLSIIAPAQAAAEEETISITNHAERQTNLELYNLEQSMKRFTYDSGYHFEYPDAVRGIYVTGNSAGGSRFETLLDLVETTDLNSMVIDIKEDHGNLTFMPEED